MPKTLIQLLSGPGVELRSVRNPDVEVSSVVSDSRQVTTGTCFVAIRGHKTDGHLYIDSAVKAGAVAIVYDNPQFVDVIPPFLGAAQVADSRKACAVMAAAVHDYPANSLTLIGVTGTNGKTTSVALVHTLCQRHGLASAALGTLGRRIADDVAPTTHTTLDSVELHSTLASLRDQGITHVAMEVSSHGLSLHRTWGVPFDVVAFTNLTQDHLDFYQSMAEYEEAKALLFTEYVRFALPNKQIRAVINVDDPAGRRLVQRTECPVITYGLGTNKPAPHVTAEEISHSAEGTQFRLCVAEDKVRVALRLPGRFNLVNALCAAGCAVAVGMDVATIAEGLEAAQPVRGRFERVEEGQDFGVVVDYAHTPEGLRNILASVRELTAGRLLCVFGCGGDRDRSKRPLMGGVAAQLADIVIVTSDNPRSEPPSAIIDDILEGITGTRAQVHVEPDRRKAIQLAVSMCRTGDMVVIAGKGHETYQIFADRKVHFDDYEEAQRALRDRLSRERP